MKYNVISKYVFEQSDTSKYFLKEIQGVELANFLGTAKKDNGKQNVRFGEPDEKKPSDKGFDKIMFGLGRISGIIVSILEPTKAHGDTANPTMKGNDCLLLEFSDNNKYLTILVVKDMAKQRKTVFEDWLNGELIEVVDSELLPLNEKAASRKD